MVSTYKKHKKFSLMEFSKKLKKKPCRGIPKIVTRVGLQLPSFTNQSLEKKHNLNSLHPFISKLISKVNNRLYRQKKLMKVMLRKPQRGRRKRGYKNSTFWRWRRLQLRQRLQQQLRGITVKRVVSRNNPLWSVGVVSVQCTANNTLLTLSRDPSKVVKGGWASAGSQGFKNSGKSTAYASQAAAKSICLKAKHSGIKALHVRLKGSGRAKAAIVRALHRSALRILTIRECTRVVHNGCRQPKKRRL